RARGQADLALAAVALVDRAALELGIAPMPAGRAGPTLAPAQREQRRPALPLGAEALPQLGLAQALAPPPQPALRAHPLAPQRPKPARMLARSRMGVTDNQEGLSEAELRERFELQGRAVYQCNRCKHQVGLTAGTVFHWTKLPLTTWFLAIYHLTQSKGGM